VRRTADGPQFFHYDTHGRLIAAPDCTKQSAKSSQFVLKGIKTGVKAAPALPGSSSACSSNSSTPRWPLLAGNCSRLFSSETAEAATGEVFVCAVLPQQQQQQQQHVGPLAAGRMLAVQHHQERELQQQLEQHRQRQQQLEMQQQEQQQQQQQQEHSEQQEAEQQQQQQ
jgi:hypothetical protein